jgi:hypothetical protein
VLGFRGASHLGRWGLRRSQPHGRPGCYQALALVDSAVVQMCPSITAVASATSDQHGQSVRQLSAWQRGRRSMVEYRSTHIWWSM